MKPNDKGLDAALSVTQIPEENMREYMRRVLTAAYAAQFQSEEYAGLVERLKTLACELASVSDAVGEKFVEINEAANAIEALLAERDEWRRQAEICRDKLQETEIALGECAQERDALKSELIDYKDAAASEADFVNEQAEKIRELKAERDALAARLAPVEDDELVVEIVANAIRTTRIIINDDDDEDLIWGNATPTQKESYLTQARAAIAAIRPHIEAAALSDLVEFSKHKNWTLKYKMPFCCDDDDQEQCWVVYEEIGSINDRDWDDIGKGETAAEAIAAALKRGR